MGAWRCTHGLWPIAGINHPEARTDDPRGEPCRWWPFSLVEPALSRYVPEAIAEDFREAHRCFSVKAWRAAAAMARRAMQATCFDLGAPDLRLQRQMTRSW